MKNLELITAFIDAICDEEEFTTTEEFCLFYRNQMGYFPSIAEIEYFEFYGRLFNILIIVKLEV